MHSSFDGRRSGHHRTPWMDLVGYIREQRMFGISSKPKDDQRTEIEKLAAEVLSAIEQLSEAKQVPR
ncbi:MAG: hypothetical protein AAF739_01405 [Pseudomonadota bacterium]